MDDTWPWSGPGFATRDSSPRIQRPVPARIGCYRPVRQLAGGGMAELFVALADRDDGASHVSALKRIRPHLAEFPEARALFAHEALLLSRFRHSGIVRVLDIAPAATEGHFAMELVHGRGLIEVVRRAQRLGVRMPLRHSIAIVAAAAEALHHAHECRDDDGSPLEVVHSDVTPANVMIAYDGSLKIVDFGVAQSRRRRADRRALPHAGTLSYMSPEQSRGEPLDRRSDVYALGIMLWELVTWSRLYRGLAPEQILARVAIGAVPLPSQLRADLPRGLESAIMTALQPARERRFATTSELAAELRAIVGPPDHALVDAWIRRVFH
ncbi:MAG TPA: serine/threonine-protein kinase [Nannocystaceae bacterium]|nr:serine/threonine-protein kinase [Nannocystaceae bacterium]